MYRIAIFKIRPEPDSTGYQMNCPAGTGTGTGYLNTCCIANFSVMCVVWIRKYYCPWFTVLVALFRLRNVSGAAWNSTHSLACCFQLCVKLH